MSDPVVSLKKEASVQLSVEDELKLLIKEGIGFEEQLMENFDLFDSVEFEDQMEIWEEKIKQFRKQGALLTKEHEQILKYLKKKAECLSD